MRRGFLQRWTVRSGESKANHKGHEGARRKAYVACEEQDLEAHEIFAVCSGCSLVAKGW